MFIAYVVVTLLAAGANIFSATLDFIRYKQVLINMAKAGVSASWITALGILCRGHHHPPACTGLLVRFGGRLPPAGRGRAGIETGCLVISKPQVVRQA
jgi:hypothetical protein